MEILEIRSSHDLTAHTSATRPLGLHSYQVNCRQFVSEQRAWDRHHARPDQALGLMTLNFELIWITAEEIQQVAAAIQATHALVALD